MLVLSRKVGESILIGDQVVVTVIASRGDEVRLGIAAPKSISILREEMTCSYAEGAPVLSSAVPVSQLSITQQCGFERAPERVTKRPP